MLNKRRNSRFCNKICRSKCTFKIVSLNFSLVSLRTLGATKRKIMINRLADSKFLTWISDDSLTEDFNLLQAFLGNYSPEFEDFFDLFLNPHEEFSKQRKLAKLKEKTENPMHKLTLNKTLATFFKLKNMPNYLSRREFKDLIWTHFNLPSIFVTTLMNQIDERNTRLSHKHQKVKFVAVQNYFGTNFKDKTIDDLLVFLITGRMDARFLTYSDFPSFIFDALESYQIKEFEDPKMYSSFVDYVITKLFIAFDPENKGRIERRNFKMDRFIKTLNAVAIPEHFLVVYKIYRDLCDDSGILTVDSLCKYDHHRILKPIVERFLNVIHTPAKQRADPTVGKKITFITFVYYITFLEDKGSNSALNVWFRVCDNDCDGIISISEIQELYEMQIKEIKARDKNDEEYDTFDMVLPRILDMIDSNSTKVTRMVLSNSKKWVHFFNMLIDPAMFNDYELLDPVSNVVDHIIIKSELWDSFINHFIKKFGI